MPTEEKDSKGWERCIHTCRIKCWSRIGMERWWKRAGGSCPRHAANILNHRECTEACPGYALVHETNENAKKLMMKTILATDAQNYALDVAYAALEVTRRMNKDGANQDQENDELDVDGKLAISILEILN